MFGQHRSTRQALIAGTVLVVLVVGASFFWSSVTATAPQGLSAKYPQLIRVWMHGDMIYPTVVHARPGRVLLRAENQTQTDVALVLERVLPGAARQRTARVNTVSKALRAEQLLTVGVGEYEFYDEAFPEAKGKLIVEP